VPTFYYLSILSLNFYTLKNRGFSSTREKRSCSAEAYDPPNSAPSFRSVLDELIDEGVDDDQIVDEVNTLMFGVI